MGEQEISEGSERLIKCRFPKIGERMWVQIVEGDERSGRGMLRNDSIMDDRLRIGVSVHYDTTPDGERVADLTPNLADRAKRQGQREP